MQGLAWLPEPEPVAYIKAASLKGRLLTWFGWGHYAIWHLSPDLKVSFDGRRETAYSAPFVAAHVALYWWPESNESFLRELDPDHAWLPRDLPLVRALQNQGWKTVFEGPISVVLSREARAPALPPAPPSMRRCFPGP
jgi:hypothetical protein